MADVRPSPNYKYFDKYRVWYKYNINTSIHDSSEKPLTTYV